jgi:Rha family phage regulatory protein
MAKKMKSKGRKKYSTPALPSTHETGNPLTLVEVQGTQVVTNSLLVARKFGKEHRHVVRAINDMINNSAQNWEQLYLSTTYKDASGKSNPMFIITRDGFSLLVMGFTGKEALKFKLDFISAFNKMEEMLRGRKPEDRLTIEQREELDTLRRESVKLEKFRHKDSLSILDLEVSALQDEFHKKMQSEMLKMFAQTGNAVLAIQGELHDRIAKLIDERMASISK